MADCTDKLLFCVNQLGGKSSSTHSYWQYEQYTGWITSQSHIWCFSFYDIDGKNLARIVTAPTHCWPRWTQLLSSISCFSACTTTVACIDTAQVLYVLPTGLQHLRNNRLAQFACLSACSTKSRKAHYYPVANTVEWSEKVLPKISFSHQMHTQSSFLHYAFLELRSPESSTASRIAIWKEKFLSFKAITCSLSTLACTMHLLGAVALLTYAPGCKHVAPHCTYLARKCSLRRTTSSSADASIKCFFFFTNSIHPHNETREKASHAAAWTRDELSLLPTFWWGRCRKNCFVPY